MASSESRIRELVAANLAVDGQALSSGLDIDTSLSDHGVSSLDVVAFAELVSREFGVTFTTEDCARLNSLRSVIEFLDG
jgi:acyl carrier protein